MTSCTGIRSASSSVSSSSSDGSVSSSSSRLGPSYQGVFAERSTTLSPASAETGMTCASGRPSSRASVVTSSADRRERRLASTRRGRSCSRRRSRAARAAAAATARWRRVCSSTPLRASTSTTTASAVVAPVTMLRVYCTCPGQSARMNDAAPGGEVAVGDVDGDALLALGAQAVGEQREVDGAGLGRRSRARPTCGRPRRAGRRGSPSSRAAGGRPGSTCRRRRSRRSRSGTGCVGRALQPAAGQCVRCSSEVAVLLAVLHGGLGDAVVGAGGAALGERRGRRPRRRRRATVAASDSTAPVQDMSPTVR